MTNEEFYKSMVYLKAKYPNWSLNIQDVFILEVWYEDFENIDYASMRYICKEYSRNNKFPPSTPYDLLNMVPKYLEPVQAWEQVMGMIQRNSSSEFFYKELYKEQPTLYRFMKDLDPYELDDFGNKCLGYVSVHFMRAYQQFLDSQRIVYVGNQLRCSSNQNLLN